MSRAMNLTVTLRNAAGCSVRSIVGVVARVELLRTCGGAFQSIFCGSEFVGRVIMLASSTARLHVQWLVLATAHCSAELASSS